MFLHTPDRIVGPKVWTTPINLVKVSEKNDQTGLTIADTVQPPTIRCMDPTIQLPNTPTTLPKDLDPLGAGASTLTVTGQLHQHCLRLQSLVMLMMTGRVLALRTGPWMKILSGMMMTADIQGLSTRMMGPTDPGPLAAEVNTLAVTGMVISQDRQSQWQMALMMMDLVMVQ